MSWLEVAMTLDGELAEPVAELFARYAQGGVALEQQPGNVQDGNFTSNVTVKAYIPLDEHHEERQRSIEHGLWHLGQIAPLPQPAFTIVQQQDWSETWREHYKPIAIGKSLLVIPAWLQMESSERKPIILDPGMAFGTGTHPTTRMCLLAIEDYCRPGDVVIDVGCGSGILSIGAMHCGAQHVIALDTDPEAISSARRNLDLNKNTERIELIQGDLEQLLEEKGPFSAPLVVANILAPVLIAMMDQGLDALLSPGGTVILSGILEGQVDDVLSAAGKIGLRQIRTYAEDDWRSLVLAKKE